jgi:hypothetical protein
MGGVRQPGKTRDYGPAWPLTDLVALSILPDYRILLLHGLSLHQPGLLPSISSFEFL